MPTKERRRRAARKVYDEERKAKGKRNRSADKKSKRAYAKQNTEALKNARKRFGVSKSGTEAKMRYNMSAKGIETRSRYNRSNPEVMVQARKKYDQSKPEVGKLARRKYDDSKPEIGRQARKRYGQSKPEIGKHARQRYDHSELGKKARKNYNRRNPEIGIAARTRYAQSRPEVGVQSRKRYAQDNPEVSADASRRYRERKRRRIEGVQKTDDAHKLIRRQRRFIHLLPSREYSYIRNRRFLKTGRMVAQQKMERNVILAYDKLGHDKSATDVRHLVQRAINMRERYARALKKQADALKAECEKILSIAETTPDASLRDLCGDSGHQRSREPFFYDFAYKPPEGKLKLQSRTYAYARIRANAISAVTKIRARIVDNKKRSRMLHRIAAARMRRKTRLFREVAFRNSSGSLVCSVIPLGNHEEHEHPQSWPCSNQCQYPTNGVEKLTEILRVFTNASQIRRVIDENHIDPCSNLRGCHKAEISYPITSEVIAACSDLMSNFDDTVPFIQIREKLGHSICCLPNNCKSRLMFLRQLAVHFKQMSFLVRRIYRILLLDRILQTMDEALIRADVEFLENVTKDEMKSKRDEEGVSVKRMQSPVTAEEQFPSLPYARKLEAAFSEKPEFVCSSCCSMHYRKTVKQVFVKEPRERKRGLRMLKDTTPTVHVGGRSRHGPVWNRLWDRLYAHLKQKDPNVANTGFYLCYTCYEYVKAGESFSPLSIFNSMQVDDVPPEIADLNEFERLCIQLGKCFQVVCRLGSVGSKVPVSDRLKVVKGQVLYYPLPLDETIRQLSEASHNAPGMHILLNSVPTRNRDIWQSVIRLDKVRAAMHWLKEHNPMYKDTDLNRWMQCLERLVFDADRVLEEEKDENITETDVQEVINDLGQRGAFPKATDKPMLKKLQEDEKTRILDSYTIRPLDKEKPHQSDLQIYQMLRIEEEKVDNRNAELDLACFPALYPMGRFGQAANREQRVKPSEFIKNRLFNQDPRFRRDHQYIFHLLWSSELRSVSSSIYQTLRNSKRFDNMNVEEFVQFVSEGNKHFEYCLSSVFRNMRGSPEYWKSVKMKLLCMCRELGPPTWFLTLSAAEFNWEDMSAVLRKMNSDLPNIDEVRTSTLTAIDPVMTQDHFHKRFTSYFNEAILSKEQPPLGLVWDYFWRVEYQARGHIHYHILLWVKDAPRIGVDSEEAVKQFINEHATCKMPDPQAEPELHNLVTTYQVHTCNSYCLKTVKSKSGGKVVFRKICRFGFPRRPCEEIQFRDPLDVLGKRRQGKFEKRFYELPRSKVEQRVNDYNEFVLLGWKANVDVSFIGESTMSLANYVCGYVTKGDKGATELWDSIDRNEPVWKQLYSYAFQKLRNRECGIIEAVDILRGQPLYGKSRQTGYINARMPSSRTVCMKPWTKLKQLQEVDPNSKDKYELNWIDDFYPNRPEKLNDMCLYDFVRLYKKTDKPKKDLRFIKGSGGVALRSEPLLLSHPVFKRPDEIESYRYGLLLMFKPFRNEVDELLGANGKCSAIFEQELSTNSQLAEHHAMLQAQVAQLAAQEEKIKRAQEAPDSQEAQPDPLGMPVELEDVIGELIAAMNTDLTDTTWEEDLNNMTAEQREVFELVKLRTTNPGAEPLRLFVSGAGGTGKSFLISTIKKFLQKQLFESETPVAISAPTGLAAFNVSGLTLHRLFKLPVQHGKIGPFHQLNRDEQKLLQHALRDLKLLIIDEVSMVSNELLLFIDKRLQEIFRNSAPFGGLMGIMVVGDFLQLKPVNAEYIFEEVSSAKVVARNLGVGSSNIWRRDLNSYHELRTNVRQQGDPEYAALLDRLRFGKMTENDVKMLEERLIPLRSTKNKSMLEMLADYYLKIREKDNGVVCLLPKTKMVDELNLHLLHRDAKEIVQVLANESIFGYRTQAEKAKAQVQLQKRAKRVSDTAGVEMQLTLGIGARIMLRRNLSVEKGLVNGAIGTVLGFVRDSNNIVTGIKVLFDKQKEIQTIERVTVCFNLNSRIVVFLKQLPVTLAYSVTIHKSQGISLQNVLLDAGNNIFQRGMSYVGLSRVRSRGGLHLINFDGSRARSSMICIEEINRLRSQFTPDLPLESCTFSKLPSRKDRVWYSKAVGPCPISVEAENIERTAATGKRKLQRDFQNEPQRKKARLGKSREPVSGPRPRIIRETRKKFDKNAAASEVALAVPEVVDVQDLIPQQPWPAFSNLDGASCYANSAAHLLFSSQKFREFLSQNAFGNFLPALRNVMQRYENQIGKHSKRAWSMMSVRKSLGYPFLSGQQCARQFIERVLNKAMLEDLFRVNVRQMCERQVCTENQRGV